jgi:hypothetical protein
VGSFSRFSPGFLLPRNDEEGGIRTEVDLKSTYLGTLRLQGEGGFSGVFWVSHKLGKIVEKPYFFAYFYSDLKLYEIMKGLEFSIGYSKILFGIEVA